MALADNLLAYYKMDEASGNRADSIGAHTLTDVNTVGSATGKISNGADFEESNSEYLYNTSTDFHITGSNAFTVSLWFKPESLSSNQRILIANKKTDNSVGDCFKIFVDVANGSKLKVQTWASSGSFLTLDTGVVPVVGNWYHVVFVKASASDWKAYVNGVLVVSSTSTRSNNSTNLNGISIGAEDQGSSGVSGYFDGIIDEVGIWTRALSADEVSQIFNSNKGNTYSFTATPSLYGCVNYYKLDESSGNVADVINYKTLTNTNSVGFSTGKINNAADFVAGSSKRLSATVSTVPVSGDFSFSLWYKGASPVGDGIFGWGSAASTGQRRSLLVSSGNAYFGGYSADLNSNYAINDGNWHHIVVTYSGTTLTIYVDGASRNSTTVSLNTTNTTLAIGARADNTSYITGSVDEAGIWNRALSSTEVSALYGGGNAFAYPWLATIVSVGVQTATFSLPASAISLGNTRAPSTQVVTASIPAYSVAIEETITPSAQVATFSIPQYFVLAGDILVQAAAQVVTASIPAFSVLLDRVFGVAAQVATFSLPSRTVSIKETLTPAAQVATFSIPAYSVQFGQTVAVGVQTATFSIPAYSVTAETDVHPSVQVATFSIPAYSIGLGIVTAPLTQVLTFTLPTLYKVGAIWTKIARSTNATWSRTSRNSN